MKRQKDVRQLPAVITRLHGIRLACRQGDKEALPDAHRRTARFEIVDSSKVPSATEFAAAMDYARILFLNDIRLSRGAGIVDIGFVDGPLWIRDAGAGIYLNREVEAAD